VYIGFAVADGRPKVVVVKSSIAAAFVVLAATAGAGPGDQPHRLPGPNAAMQDTPQPDAPLHGGRFYGAATGARRDTDRTSAMASQSRNLLRGAWRTALSCTSTVALPHL